MPSAMFTRGYAVQGAAAVRARVRYVARVVAPNGDILIRDQGEVGSTREWTELGGSSVTATEALVAMYQSIAGKLGASLVATPLPPAADPAIAERAAADRAAAIKLMAKASGEWRAAYVKRYRNARFTADGRVVSDHDESNDHMYWDERRVVGETHDRLRVVENAADVRLLLWIDRADVRPVITAATPLLPRADSASPPADGPGVFLDRGAPVVVGEADAGMRPVKMAQAVIAAGWVSADVVGDVFVTSATARLHDAEKVEGFSSVDVFDAPSGNLLGEIEYLEGHRIGKPVRGWQEVALFHDRFTVRGFVRVAKRYNNQGGSLYGDVSHVPEDANTTIPAASCLLDGPDGVVIGKILVEQRVRVDQTSEHGWQRFTIASSWGDVTVWTQVGAGVAGCGG